MNDADRHDQIAALDSLKTLLDDDTADASDVRDAAIRAVNSFDMSIRRHHDWRPYTQRGAGDANIRSAVADLGKRGVEHHPEYPGRLRRRVGGVTAEAAIRETRTNWKVEIGYTGLWKEVGNSRSRADAEMIGARHLADLRETTDPRA